MSITLKHVTDVVGEDRPVRTDHVGFIGIVTPARWPNGATVGSFVELTVESWADFDDHPVRPFFDAATRLAVAAFFRNGGARCTVFAVCVQGPGNLSDPVKLPEVLDPLIERLQDDDDIAILAMPPLAWLPAGWRGAGVEVGGQEVVERLLRHCRTMNNRFLLVDAPRELDELGVAAWVAQLRRIHDLDCSYGAIYYPWLAQGDVSMPPSGMVAGVMARTDLDNAPYGVRVAPANQPVHGFTHLTTPLSWTAGRALLESGVNPVLEQAGRGLVLWGARTMSADPRWNQITARRIVSFITERVQRDAEWVVFETQNPELWETVARMVRSRLDAYWTAGLLTGQSQGAEYEVQCDRELNPPAVRDRGEIHFKVLLRPISTTEFIEVELQLGR